MKIVIKHSYGFLAKAIQFFQFLYCLITGRTVFEGNKLIMLPNHSDIWADEYNEVYGAQAKGVEKSTFAEAFHSRAYLWIYELPENCDPDKLYLYCRITTGIAYQYLNFILHIVDTIYRLFKKYRYTGHWLEKARKSKTRVYCIEHTARGINYALPEEIIPSAHRINPVQFKEWCDAHCALFWSGYVENGKFIKT